MNALDLHKQIQSVAPSLVGVSIGNSADKATWEMTFSPAATDQQKQAAQAVVAAYTDTSFKTSKIALAWDTCMARCEVATLIVATSAGTYSYGIDANTRDNIQSVMIGVLAGITPNPRPWTPKGATAAINVTYADIGAIAGAVGAAYDAMIQRYLTHKETVKRLTTTGDVAAYDVTIGWPY